MMSSSIEALCRFKKKDDIIAKENKLKLETKISMRKAQLIRIVSEHMVYNDIFDEDVLLRFLADTSELSQTQLEIEKAKNDAVAELENAKTEAEAEVKKLK